MDIKTMPERWVAAWSTDDSGPWVAMYKPNGTYIDHAFQIRRSGHKTLQRHHDLWRTANPDFVMTLVPGSPIWWSSDTNEETGNGSCSFRTINEGTFKNDLHRFKASGKKFEFRGVIDIVIEGGLIKELNEWYSQTPFDSSQPLGKYHTLSDEDVGPTISKSSSL
jgi:hypothetical protein